MTVMKLIARRGETEAWAEEMFNPATDDVTIHTSGLPDQRVMWQRALKFGYWESAD